MKKGEHKEIFSIRKYKAYGANSALIGLVGPAVLMGSLLSPVQAEESTPVPDSKPLDRVETSGASTSDVETDHLIITSSQPGVHPTEETDSRGERGTSEGLTTPKRAVSIVYKVRYVDRQRKTVVHEVTKTKTVETSEAKARATVTEIGAELANDRQLENYYVPDGNPTTMTKEIVEGEDNVFVYEVEGFGEAEATNRTVTLKYTVDYVDEKSGLVLASEDKEETVSTFEAVAKKEVTVQASLDGHEVLKGWSLPANAADHQTLTLVEGSVGKVTFKVHNSDTGKPRKKRKVEYPNPAVTGQPYLTLENRTDSYISKESMTFAGNGQHTYEIRYKVGFTNIEASDLEMTQGAKDLGFTLDLEGGWLTATLTPTRAMAGDYEVGFQSKTNPQVKVTGTIKITTTIHYGFMVLPMFNPGYEEISYFPNDATKSWTTTFYGRNDNDPISRREAFIYKGNLISPYMNKDNITPKLDVEIDGLRMATTPFGYFMDKSAQTIENVTPDTKRYYAMIPIFAPMDRSTDYPNNDKQGLSITDFHVLSASDGVEVKLVDLRKDKAPDKGKYSNALDFQTMPKYLTGGNLEEYGENGMVDRTPYYLQFTKLPKTAGNYSVKIQITDSVGLVKTFTLNFTTYENSISGYRSYDELGTRTYALTNADALFEPNEEYVDKATGKVTLPISDKEQILGKVTLNKDNAYIKADRFPAGVELRAVPGKVDTEGHPTEAYVVKKEGATVAVGKYSFSVKAHDGHYQTGAPRTFEFEIVDAINPIPNQHWREGTVPTPIPVSMENNSKITGIRVESSGDYALFEGNSASSTISIYGLKSTLSQQKARVYVTFTDGNGEKHETFTDFYYDIDPNPVADLAIDVTPRDQEITEGDSWKEMVITTTPSEGVTIKVDKTKLPKGTRLEGNKITGKGLYEGTYDVPVLAIKGDVVKSTLVHLVVRAGTFTVPPETVTVPVLSEVSGLGLQNVPDDANITYRANDSTDFSYSGLTISNDGTKITGTPTRVNNRYGYSLTATISRRGSNGLVRTTTTTYTIYVAGLAPSLTISSATQPTDAYTSNETRLLAPIGTKISPITIKHDPHSRLTVSNSLPAGLTYSYDAATHTGTITGTPSATPYKGYVYEIPVSVEMPSEYSDGYSSYSDRYIYKNIYIEVTPITSGLTIDHENQTFAANEEMTSITVSDFDERATIDLENAPSGVSYDETSHQVIGSPTAGVGTYRFNVRAIMPSALGGQVTRKQVILTVTALQPTLSANLPSVEVTSTASIPEITITKDSLSTLSEPTVRIQGSGSYQPLSSLGLSYDAESRKIIGRPTIVGNHTIHLSTTLSKRYSGAYGGVTKELDIPLTVNAKEFDFIEDQERTTTVLSPIAPVDLTVAEGIDVEVGSGLPSGVTYNAVHKRIEGTPTEVGDYSVTVTARPSGVSGNDKRATIRFHVTKLPATIEITPREQNVQVGTPIAEVSVKPNEHASVYGTDALLNAVSGTDSGVAESNIANYFLGAYGLTYNPTNRTITGTPTKTGRIVFTFIARNDSSLGGAEARETLVLNVVETLSKIPVITEAQEGANVIKGSGVAGATVTVTLPDGVEKTAEVAADGTWTVATTAPLVKGQSISARQKEENKTLSNDISATVIAKEGLVPSKEAGVDAIIEGATTITGKGINGSTISVTLPDTTVKTTTVTEGTWSVTLDNAVVKGQNILVTQTEPNKSASQAVTATVVPKITKGDKGETGAAGPKGEQGVPGTPGKDGFTPEISVTRNDGGSYTITITQPNGKEPIRTTVKDGTNGTNGIDGLTPKVLLTPIYEDPAHPRTRRTRSVEDREAQPTRKQIGVHITVYYDTNNNGTYDVGVDKVISEEDIYDGVDGIDGHDGTNGTNGTDGRDGTNGTNGTDGAAGATGATGAAGRDGKDGKDILNGTENPGENQGKDGDTFVNTKTGDVFVKENGTWKPAGNIKGPKGEDGKDILNGKTDPTPDTGKDGDTFVNTATGDVFVKENGTWKSAGNIRGPKGDKGENGTNGTDGRDGTNGTNGTDGVAGATGATGAAGHDGRDGKDGQSPTVTVRENTDGSHTIVITNPNGNTIETTVRDGKSPTVTVRENTDGTHTITIENADGKTTTTTVRDGKNGQSPTVSIRNNNDGTHTVTIINPDGSKTEAVIKDGKDGKDGQSPTVSVTNNGNGTHTIIITSSDGKVTTTVIKDGKCGCNDKPGGTTPGTTPNPNPGGTTPGTTPNPNLGGTTPGTTPNPNLGGTTPGTTPNPNLGGTTPGTTPNSNAGEPTPGTSTTPKPGEPTPGGVPGIPEPPVHEIPEYIGVVPVEPTPNEPTPEMPVPSSVNMNPMVPTLVLKNHENRLPETGTQSDYLFLLLGSGILLSLYVGRRKED